MTNETNQATHTPIPWTVDEGIASQAEPHPDWTAVGVDDEEGFAEVVAYCHPDNAAMIVRAVNAHDALLEACRAAEDVLDSGHPDPEKIIGDVSRILRAAIAAALTLSES